MAKLYSMSIAVAIVFASMFPAAYAFVAIA